MRSARTAGFRIAGLLAMTLLIAHCGDNSVHIRTGGGVNPFPGTFTGTTGGGSLVIVVDSIRSIAFECDGENIAQTFSPPKSINSDGTFSVEFTDGGRTFTVTGTFTDQNNVEGEIDDHDNHCDGSFSADRSNVIPTPPTPTPTSSTPPTTVSPSTGVTPTLTPSGGPTSSGGGSTTTPTTVTSPCPNKVTIEGQGQQADLDTGWTGIAQNQTVVGKGSITVALACTGTPGSCAPCTVSGPIESTTVVNNHRCSNDTTTVCTTDAQCTGGTCAFFFGAPLPLSSGGVPVCVTNRVSGAITGTANPDTGDGSSTLTLVSSVFTGLTIAQPCPTCSGSGFNKKGQCVGGPKDGSNCTVHGTTSQFGNTSLDCPPNSGANIGNLNISLNPTTGTSELTPNKTCTTIPFNGEPCYCQGQAQPNDCTSGICNDPNGTGGTCTDDGPFNVFCSIEKFRTCTQDADCPTGAGNCQGDAIIRPCSGQTAADGTKFKITNNMKRTGTPDKNNPVFASTFCVGATSSSGVNTAGGLPGPGGLVLPSKTCYTDTCSF